MKFMFRKTISVLLALILCFGISFSINVPVSADYVDYVYSVDDYIYNWGERGEVSTFLSQNAESFYEDNSITYEYLSSLSGSSSESGVPSSALYRELHNLMESNHDYKTSYDATKNLFQYTDCENSGGKISSFYSGTPIGPSWNGSWNREHTWPNSKGDKSGSGENDLMMLRPTSTSENSSRGNKAYGQSSGYYNPNSESNGKYDLRGDVARIVLYVYVRWECTNTGSGYNPNGIFGTDGVFESKEVMLNWIQQDPVDTWELGRNDSAESILGTRNVFVDYPELAFLLYNEEIPSDYTTPSGSAEGNSYTITAQSNNSAWGTVSVSGKTVNATPKTGYEVSGYQVINGTATVTRNGNSFAIVAESDVNIQINFAPRSQKTVKFMQNDVVVDTKIVYSGDEIVLPTYSGNVEDGNTFVGWVENSIEETTNMPTYYTAGSKYAVADDVTLYALYSKNVTDGGTSSNVFEKYSGALVPGDYIITFEGGAMKAASTDKNRLQIADIDDSGNEMIVTDESIIWRLTKDGNYWTFYNVAADKYAAGTGTKNTAKLIDSVDDFAKWTASGNSTYEFVNLGNDDKGVNPLLRKNSGIGFACYAKNTNVGGANTLYKRVSGTVYYFTSACAHQNAYVVDEVASTCTQTGYTAGEYCPDCDEYISGHEIIDAAHKYSSNCDAQCSACGETRRVFAVHKLDGDHVCEDCGAVSQEYTIADANNDGKINSRDYVIIMRYLNGWNFDVTINALDANNDGKINARDCALLMQFINGWDVSLGS